MNRIVKFLKLHPVIVTVYIIYLAFWADFVRTVRITHSLEGEERLYMSEALAFHNLILLAISSVYFFIALIQAVRSGAVIYLKLLLFIAAIPLIIILFGRYL
jgi:hypothetical protein